jgi:replicative DNA helicase
MQLSFMRQRNVEQFFAASIFIRPVETIEQCGWLQPSDLLHEGIREYWKLAKQRISPGMDEHQASEISVQSAFECGIQADVMGWSVDLPFMDVPQAYAAEISRRQYLINIGKLMNQLAVAVGSQDDQEARRLIQNMSSLQRAGNLTVPNAVDVAEQFERIVNTGQRSIDTFIPPIDSATGGLERQTLSIIAARTSMGKTALIWQIARNVAMSGQTAVFFSLEMSAASLWARAACPRVGVTWRDLRAGRVNEVRKKDLIAESYSLATQYADHLRIIDTPQNTESIWRMVAELKPDLVVADHLRLIQDRADSEVKRLGMITENLKNMAKSTNTAMLLAVQLNRSVEARSQKEPMLSDIRDSGEVEENADLVGMLYRKDYYENFTKPPRKSLTELWIRKFRDGPAGILINLMFDTEQEWFEERTL